MKGKEGQIVVALFAKPDGFPSNINKAAFSVKVAPDHPTHRFTNLPAGHYVVVVFHDLNNNGKVDKNLLGSPNEPIGLSNHPKIHPPKNMPNFARAKVDVSKISSINVNPIKIGR